MGSASSVADASEWRASRSSRRRVTAGATLRSSARPPSPRLEYVDSLRAVAIVSVVLVHVAEVFNPWDEWHIANAERSRLVGEIAVLAAPWVMPLVMLLAGVGAAFSLRSRSNRTYIRERAVRLLLPLATGVLALVPPQVYLERRLRGQFTGSFLEFYPHFFEGIYPRGNFSWHHLWFLAHLFAYSVVAIPLFRYLSGPRGGRLLALLARWCGRPGGILWLAVPLILERNLLWGLFPERHMLATDWSNHALLFVAYVYGFVLANSPWLVDAIDTQWPRAAGVAAIGTALLTIGTWSGLVPARIPPPYSFQYLAFWTLYGVCAWGWMVALLGIARRWLDRPRPILAHARRLGYALYVVHQPIIIGVAYVVVQWHVPVLVKFAVTLAASVSGTIVVAELCARFSTTRGLLGLSPMHRAPSQGVA